MNERQHGHQRSAAKQTPVWRIGERCACAGWAALTLSPRHCTLCCAKSLQGEAPCGSAVYMARWIKCSLPPPPTPSPCPTPTPHRLVEDKEDKKELMNKEELMTLPVQGTSHCSCLEHCFLFDSSTQQNPPPLVPHISPPHPTTLTVTLQALFDDPVQQRATVITKRRQLVAVHGEAVRNVDAEPGTRQLRRRDTGNQLKQEHYVFKTRYLLTVTLPASDILAAGREAYALHFCFENQIHNVDWTSGYARAGAIRLCDIVACTSSFLSSFIPGHFVTTC